MGFLDSIKQAISDKLDDVLGEEPTPKVKEEVKEEKPIYEGQDEITLDESAYADYYKVQDGSIVKIVGGVSIDNPTQESQEEYNLDFDANVNVNPLLNVERVSSDLNPVNMVEEHCQCKVFFRTGVPFDTFSTMEKLHVMVDKSNPGISVEIAVRCAMEDKDADKYIFVGMSSLEQKVYNFIYEGSLESNSWEFQMYLITLIGRCNLTQLFYLPYEDINLMRKESLNCIPLHIHTEDIRVLWSAELVESNNDMKKVGQVMDMTMSANDSDEEICSMVSMNLNGTLYPNSHRFFTVSRDKVLHMVFLSYVEDDKIEDISAYVLKVYKLMKGSE